VLLQDISAIGGLFSSSDVAAEMAAGILLVAGLTVALTALFAVVARRWRIRSDDPAT